MEQGCALEKPMLGNQEDLGLDPGSACSGPTGPVSSSMKTWRIFAVMDRMCAPHPLTH